MSLRPGSLWLLCLGLCLALAGATFVAVLWHSYERAQETRSWQPVPCRILSSTVQPERATRHSPVKHRVTVRYEYEVLGAKHVSELVRRGDGPTSDAAVALERRDRYLPGQKLTCWVKPGAPEIAVLEHGTRAALYTLWFPLLFVIGGLVMAWRAWSSR